MHAAAGPLASLEVHNQRLRSVLNRLRVHATCLALQAAAADKEDKQLAAAAKAEISKLMTLKAEVTAAETGCVLLLLLQELLCQTLRHAVGSKEE